MTYLKVTPHDPIVARDGRPFGAGSGSRMKSLGWPTPSMIAGSLRTMLGKEEPDGFINSVVTKLKSMEVAGPLPLWNGDLFFPAPKDFALRPCNAATGTPRACFRLRPRGLAEGEYCDLPWEVPRPVLLPDEAGEDFKPEPPPAFWSSRKMAAWLGESEFPPPPESRKREPAGGFLDATEKDERTHVQIAPERGAAAEHLLFSTISLAFPEGLSMALRVSGLDGTFAGGFHPAGGERRLAYWETAERAPWLCPSALAVKLRDAPLIRMVLATPALFRHGWKPDWIAENREGCPPGIGVKLRLVGVTADRWTAVSGFGLEARTVGPKPMRRMVPAGSVYFFEYVEGDCEALSGSGWLAPVSDLETDGQDRRDGFGLALWGVWSE